MTVGSRKNESKGTNKVEDLEHKQAEIMNKYINTRHKILTIDESKTSETEKNL